MDLAFLTFFPNIGPPRRVYRGSKPPSLRNACAQSPSSSALDSVAPSVKLNAVAEALARRKDYNGMLQIVDEMQNADITLEPSSLTSIIDSTILSPSSLAQFLRKVALSGYGKYSGKTPVGTEQNKLDPERAMDVSLATGFLGVVGLSVSAEFVEPTVMHHSADDATAVLGLLLLGLVFDRYAAEASLWKRIEAGMRRIFSDDPVRSARVDAGHFVVAYLLGLPWLVFRPDVKQILAVEKNLAPETSQDYLVWLVAGAAVEDEMDGLLIEADLQMARTFLRKVGHVRGVEDRIRTAVAAAKLLLHRYETLHNRVTDHMLRGESAGACIATAAEALSTQ